MALKPGTRLRGAADATEVVVVRAPGDEVDLRCGGHPMLPVGDAPAARPALDPSFAAGTEVGKRYTDAAGGLELLCTKAGPGSLSLGGAPLSLKTAKPLPSSD
ncbi:hypothetical protein [Pseudofrankia sp. DC12]|uniref:hypothetical protein n=1 Tax=Pseudofrankia sp. DC12 TaxID=683315 RepID=UPI0005F79965|nr:hypothetical protein [Pseudofrankia sp. DC12]